MGVNLSLIDKDGRDLPDWDCCINGGAKDIFKMLGRELPVMDLSDQLEDYIVRPSDFSAWRRVIGHDNFPNCEMYLGMLDRLESDPLMKIYVSY